MIPVDVLQYSICHALNFSFALDDDLVKCYLVWLLFAVVEGEYLE